VAVGEVKGPAEGLRLADELGGSAASLAGYHLYHATRAELLRRLGRAPDAAAAYEAAIALAGNDAERAFLRGQLESLPGRAPR
jgi:RNA polymerase sigma-70 factor, ECF subfamily